MTKVELFYLPNQVVAVAPGPHRVVTFFFFVGPSFFLPALVMAFTFPAAGGSTCYLLTPLPSGMALSSEIGQTTRDKQYLRHQAAALLLLNESVASS